MSTASHKQILILAGPNGAGKTTFAREFLVTDADCPTFLNADLIADELSPHEPARAAMQAGRLMIKRIRETASRGESFAFETTLADRTFARSIPKWRAAGYRVSLWFLSLSSPELAIARVQERVRQGGHFVPDAVVRRRFRSGWKDFETVYKPIVDGWLLYDNSGEEPVLLDWADTP